LNKISAEAFHVRFYKGAYQLKLIDLTLITPIAILLENIKDNVKNQGFIRDFYSPPEDPDIKSVGKYKRESFSLGVLFFLMLKGNFPFNQEEIDVSEKEELGEFYNISYEDLEVNEETCRLLKGLLEIDIEKRISIEEARKSVFFKEVSRNIRKNIEDIRKNANLECFMKPIYGFFKVLLVRFFADQIEKDNLLEIFQEIDEDSDGFIDGGLFGLETIRKNLGFEDFLILSLRKWNLEENKAKDFVFMEISKGNAKVLILENLWEFMGKELIEKEVLERLFKEISRPNIQVFLKDFEKIDF
jgi:serine/threonine protein kinase